MYTIVYNMGKKRQVTGSQEGLIGYYKALVLHLLGRNKGSVLPMSSVFTRFLAPVALAASLFAGAAQAENPVVVELFTSQGCSSCPPADAMLHTLAKRDDVIPLALHVDYWDYIGWKDAFANPAHSDRQRKYAVAGGRRSIYTPQMIVNGETSIVGARGMELADAIQAHKARDTGVTVTLSRNGETLQINASARGRVPDMVVHVLRYQNARDVKILRGENAGRHLTYANVVEDWQVLTDWSGREDLQTEMPISGAIPIVVLVQEKGHGPILAAARLH